MNRQKIVSIIFIILGFFGSLVAFCLYQYTDSTNYMAEGLLFVLLIAGLSLIMNGIQGIMDYEKRRPRKRVRRRKKL